MTTVSDNGLITTQRGDSFEFPLFINIGDNLTYTRYPIGYLSTAKIYVGVMEPNQMFENAIIRQVYSGGDFYIEGEKNLDKYTSEGDLIIKFSPKDTCCLRPGTYYYQIILTDDSIYLRGQSTIVPKTLFTLC